MATAIYNNATPILWTTGRLLWARIRMPNGTTAGEAAVPERTTPVPEGVYSVPTIPYTLQDGAAADAQYTVEFRDVPTQDAAGFDSPLSKIAGIASFTPGVTSGGTSGTIVPDYITLDFADADEVPTAVSLLTFTDADSGADLSTDAGLTLPAAFTLSGSTFSLQFIPTGAAAYAYTYRLTWADGSTNDASGTKQSDAATLTSRSLIESRGLVNTDTWADANGTKDATHIQAQFDRVVNEAQRKALAVADEFGLSVSFPPASTDPQYQSLVDAATDFATARLMQIRPEPVAQGKRPPGVAEELAAVEKMRDAFAAIKYRGAGVVSAPVADVVTLFPSNRLGCYRLPLCG